MALERILAKAKRKISRHFEVRQGHTAFGFDNIYPIGNAQGSLILNKAGRVVLRARHNGQVVKLYEAFSAEHALFITAVSERMPDLFPKVLGTRGAWVMTEWVEGQRLTGETGQHQIQVLRRIHSLVVDDLPPAGFCYIKDFILPRFKRVASLAGIADTFTQSEFWGKPSLEKKIVVHPDISPNNLLRTADGQIKCIDNELLCTGSTPLLDVCNAVRPLSVTQRSEAVKNWFAGTSATSQMINNTAKLWILREVGAAFTRGDFELCNNMVKDINSHPEHWLPFSF